MKFQLTATRRWGKSTDPHMVALKSLGFPLCVDKEHGVATQDNHIDIEINTLDDLVELGKKCGRALIITGDKIEIYNDYRE